MNAFKFIFFGLPFCLFVCDVFSQEIIPNSNDSLIGGDFETTVERMVSEIGNVYFDSGSFELNKMSKSKLNKLVLILSNNPISEILVVAHTDSKGGEQYNERLSEERAKTIKLFMMKSGVAENRIYLEAFGEKKPINRCVGDVLCDESLHKENRRAEFIVFSD